MASKATQQIREDRKLVSRLLTGEEEAFRQFLDDYASGLYRFTLPRVDHDEALAQEIVQATVVGALEDLDGFRGEATLFTWLCGCCRHQISAHYRRLKRRPQVELVEDAPEIRKVLDALAAGIDGPEDDLRRKEARRLVHLVLDHLPPRYGRALEWKYFEGLPVREIADRLGMSPKAAESVLTRARDSFRVGFKTVSKGLDGGFRGLRLVPAEGSGS